MVHQYDAALDAFENYHLAKEKKEAASILGGPALPALGHAVSGAAGAAIANVVSYPLALCITRLQVQKQLASLAEGGAEKEEYRDVFDAAEKIYETEGGIQALYAGCVQDTTKTVLDSFLFFLAYNFLRKGRLASWGTKRLPALEEIAVGMVAGAFAKLFTTPISNIVTRKQTAAMFASSTAGARKPTVRDIAAQIRKDKGLAGFWSGYSASLILTVNPALTMLLHNSLLRLFVKSENRANPGSRMTFILAATSKAIASSITYPFQLAKSRAQVSNRKPLTPAPSSDRLSAKEPLAANARRAERQVARETIISTVVEIARQEGAAGLYRGLSGEIVKGFLSHGLTMLVKERIHVLVIQLYYAVLRALKKYPSPGELAGKAQDGATAATQSVMAEAGRAQEGAVAAKDRLVDAVKQAPSPSEMASRVQESAIAAKDSLISAVKQAPSPAELASKALETAVATKNTVITTAKELPSRAAALTVDKIGEAGMPRDFAPAGDPYKLKITPDQMAEVARRSQRSVGDVKEKMKEMSGRVVDIMVELILEGKQAKADFAATYVGFGDDE